MARESTEAGDYYNNYVYEFLKERFNEFPVRHPLNILDEIKNKFVEWSFALLENPIKDENIIIETDGEKETKYIYQPYQEINKDNNDINKKTNNEIPLIPKACINDEMGFAIYRSSEYEPSYSAYINNDNLSIKLEVLGNVKIEEVYAELDLNQIVIKGNKEKDSDIYMINKLKEGNSSEYYHPSTEGIKLFKETRKYGKFNLIIPFGNDIKLASELPKKEEEKEEDLEKGIKIFNFDLAKRRKK